MRETKLNDRVSPITVFALGMTGLALASCGTVFSRLDSADMPSFYAGVDFDLNVVGWAADGGWHSHPILIPLAIIDLPLSAVADTILLPYDALMLLVR